VAPGGVLVYAVCSSEPEEAVHVLRTFLAENPRFQADGDDREIPGTVRPFLDAQGFLQTYPHLRYMDGFFAARLRLKR
jgi:16S rRNA (cytosine967-C5)-methyltransferase